MVDIAVNDVILDSGQLYVVTYVDELSSTIDVKCYNRPLTYKAIPIANLSQPGVEILKSIPNNVKFLFGKR